jgi:pyruvate formate lyase activating enzyme
LCKVRAVEGPRLVARSFGHISALNIDPVEKKPLYHFLPGSRIFSVGGWGCNLRCDFCQNWSISQQTIEGGERMLPDMVVDEAIRRKTTSVAYTYNEPLINIEFVAECCRLARAQGLRNVLVTNGYINPKPAADLMAFVDAANVDIKSMDDSFYHTLCGGHLAPVQAFIRQARSAGCHIELTNLVIPGENDDDADFENLAVWIEQTLGADVPLHLSAYHPQYKMTAHATPTTTLEQGYRIVSRRLSYVYLGNVYTETGRDTRCPTCGNLLIRRSGYHTELKGLSGSCCTQCGHDTGIVCDA